jgi:hypothetical protein
VHHQLYQNQAQIHQQLQPAMPETSATDSNYGRQTTISTKTHQQSISQILSSTAHNYVQNNFGNEYMCEWMMMALDDDEEIEPCSRLILLLKILTVNSRQF